MAPRPYDTNLASEFYVLSVLYRLGFDASLTLGNKKAVDIVLVFDEGHSLTIDVKAVAGKQDWLMGDRDLPSSPRHFVVLVGYEGAIADPARLPRVWVFPVDVLRQFVRINEGKTLRYVPRKAILEGAAEYENAWRLFHNFSPAPPSSPT